jgi:3-dehydroquinate dehydratase-2
MLVAQGVAASEIFTGRKYPEGTVEKIYAKLLAKRENIVLVGMPACGKSTIGAALAAELGRELYDLDAEIIKDKGMPISEIFEREGEAGFRDTETRVLREKLSPLTSAVIATGGGAVLRDENLHLLRRNGRLIFLDRPLCQLLPTEDRPLASSAEQIRALYSARINRYRACADEIIMTDGVVEHAVNSILKKEKNKMKILVLNGPNLNMLGIREPDIYGRETYDDLCAKVNAYAAEKGIEVENFQSNHEGALIDKIHEAYFAKVDGIVINAGAYTHTSIALRDALNSVLIPAVEVHISKVHEREYFRRVSYIRDCCFMLINGKGTDGYLQAIDALIEKCENK